MTEAQVADPSTERIDVNDPETVEAWAAKLNVSAEQIREAVVQVGDRAADVEMRLKGTHSTTNADRVNEAGVP